MWTQTATVFERTESARSALSGCTPSESKLSVAPPSALVVWPPTVAPATGVPFWPSVTVTRIASPVLALPGPASFRRWALEKKS